MKGGFRTKIFKIEGVSNHHFGSFHEFFEKGGNIDGKIVESFQNF